MISEAIILAGGLGTRLRSAVPDLPKCMAPVAGRPFLSYIIDYYLQQGITKFIFSLGYKHEIIETFVAEQYPSLSYMCSIEDEPLGTGGAIRMASALCSTANVLIANGDTFFAANINLLADFHKTSNAACTLILKPMHNSDRYGVVETDDAGRITSFKEKQWYAESLINGGVYALNVAAFSARPFPQKFSFENDYLEKVVHEKQIFGVVQDGYFIDIGIPADYNRAQIELPQLNQQGYDRTFKDK